MLIVIANNLPPAVRGRMKLWFVEPRPNVFISGIKDSIAKKVIEYLHKYCPSRSGLIIFSSTSKAPGYSIYTKGNPSNNIIELSGLQLVIEKSISKT